MKNRKKYINKTYTMEKQTQGYHQNNKYFGQHIDKFFETTDWNKSSFESKVDFYDVDYFKPHCRDCKIVSQLEDINCLGNKRLQYLSMKHHFNNKLPSYVPFTYPFKSSEINELKDLFKPNKTYILKPENALSRRGINIIATFEEANNWIIKNPKYTIWVLQEFITNTLLYEKKKFHLRIYAIYIMNEKKIRVYVYNNGFIYQAVDEYDVANMTNDKIGLSGENSKEQVKIFPDDFVKTFGMDKYKHITSQIDIVINNTIMACSSVLNCPNNKVKDYRCFKLFGYDLLIDDKYKVWLLEINARFVSFKYPPANYLNNMYSDILNLIFKNRRKNFREVLNIDNTHAQPKHIITTKIIEGFQQLNETCKCHSRILIFLLSIIMLLVVCYFIIVNNKIHIKKHILKKYIPKK